MLVTRNYGVKNGLQRGRGWGFDVFWENKKGI
jgi:hypothetical protein